MLCQLDVVVHLCVNHHWWKHIDFEELLTLPSKIDCFLIFHTAGDESLCWRIPLCLRYFLTLSLFHFAKPTNAGITFMLSCIFSYSSTSEWLRWRSIYLLRFVRRTWMQAVLHCQSYCTSMPVCIWPARAELDEDRNWNPTWVRPLYWLRHNG